MISRVVGALGLVAVVAAGPALATPAVAATVAATATATATSATAATPATTATAAKAGYVGIVISGHGSYCVRWTAGITGDTVLNKVARVAYRDDGLIVQIDGDPSSGTADADHFWSYWHDTKASWTYSTVGASGYDPKAGTVEGWSYDDGQAHAPSPSQNPSGLYASMCAKYDTTTSSSGGSNSATPRTTSPPATRSRTPTAHATTTSPRQRSGRTSTSAVPSTSAAGPTPSTASTGSGAHPSSAARDATASRTPSHPAATSSGPQVAVVGGKRSVRASDAADRSSTSSGSPVGLIVGVGLVLVLGAGAGAVALRRRGAGG